MTDSGISRGAHRIPLIDVSPLFCSNSNAAAAVDHALAVAARDVGFVCICGLPDEAVLSPTDRDRLLAIFDLDDEQKRRLYRRKFAPENSNIYRGWFPAQPGNLTFKEGIDIGGDVAHGSLLVEPSDPLRERSPLPNDSALPGWRTAVATYYLAMERVAQSLMRSLARNLGIDANYFDASFHHGLSTLRLIRYPPRTAAEFKATASPEMFTESDPQSQRIVGAPHTDSGFMTLLAQDGVAGLQARARSGDWIDVPPVEDTLVVNFGQVLERWSAGRIRATEHRVLGTEIERFSIPFFYEARADATISPLPIDRADAFEPFQFGDYLWNRITSFVEFRGMEKERSGVGATLVA